MASSAPTRPRRTEAPATSAYYSMLAREWPDARARLDARLARGAASRYLSRLSAAAQSMFEKYASTYFARSKGL